MSGLCECGCGQATTIARQSDTRLGHVRGKPKRFVNGHNSCKYGHSHGDSDSPEYAVWKHMTDRCSNPKNPKWKDYGGRGIVVCDEWKHDYRSFLAYIGRRPSRRYSIERIDNNGNYEPGNVRWATAKQQQRNRRCNRWLEYNGERYLLVDLAKKLGVKYQTIQKRLQLWGRPA